MTEPRGERPAMSDYGVDTDAWQALPWRWAADRLGACRNYWVVTVSGDGRPHSLPVWGVWDDTEHRFAFSCAPTSRKARNLAANPQTAFTVDDTVECVSVEGRAALVASTARQQEWTDRYLAKYQPLSPELSAEFVLANLIFEVQAERAFGIIERDDEFATRATRWVFDRP